MTRRGKILDMGEYEQFLLDIDEMDLQRIFDRTHPHMRHSRRSKQKMANILGNKYGNPRFVDSIVKPLSPRERELLTRIAIHSDSMIKPVLKDINRKIMEEDKLYSREEELSIDLDVLMRWGLVFVAGLGPHVIYYIPSDLMDTLRQVLKLDELQFEDAGPPEIIHKDGLSLAYDTLTFLIYLNSNDVKLTQTGYIYKRQVKLINEFYVIKDDEPSPFANNDVYSRRFGFIFKYTNEKKFLMGIDGYVRLTDRTHEWLEKDYFQVLMDIFDYWDRFWVPGFLRSIKYELLDLLKNIGPDRWITYPSAFIRFRKFASRDMDSEGLWFYVNEYIFLPLKYLGILATNDAKTYNEYKFALTEQGKLLLNGESEPEFTSMSTSFFIQPNFEVLAPQNLDMKIRYDLETLSDLKVMDNMMIFHLTKESIYRALKRDWTVEGILDFLEGHSQTAIPQNIKQSIEDWASRYGLVRLMDVFILRCKDRSIAQEIKLSPKTSPFIMGELSSRDLIVEKDSAKDLLKALDNIGYPSEPGYIIFTEDGEFLIEVF